MTDENEDVSEIATTEEVFEAYSKLTDDELSKLSWFASFKAYEEDGKYSADALMEEALMAFLSGDRKWKKNEYPFFAVLWGTIRSISSNWAQHLASGNGDIEFKLEKFEPGENNEIDDYVRETGVSSEILVDSKMRIETLKSYFEKDVEVSELIELKLADCNGKEIKEYLDIDQKQFETLCTKLKRGIEKLLKEKWNG